MTRWVQCPACKGLGIDDKGKTCLQCKGTFAVTIELNNWVAPEYPKLPKHLQKDKIIG